MQDYYSILGVKKNATHKEIKAAFRKLCRKHHPDFNAGDRNAEERMKKINEAYSVLSNPNNKTLYDYDLRSQDQTRTAGYQAGRQNEDGPFQRQSTSEPSSGTRAREEANYGGKNQKTPKDDSTDAHARAAKGKGAAQQSHANSGKGQSDSPKTEPNRVLSIFIESMLRVTVTIALSIVLLALSGLVRSCFEYQNAHSQSRPLQQASNYHYSGRDFENERFDTSIKKLSNPDIPDTHSLPQSSSGVNFVHGAVVADTIVYSKESPPDEILGYARKGTMLSVALTANPTDRVFVKFANLSGWVNRQSIIIESSDSILNQNTVPSSFKLTGLLFEVRGTYNTDETSGYKGTKFYRIATDGPDSKGKAEANELVRVILSDIEYSYEGRNYRFGENTPDTVFNDSLTALTGQTRAEVSITVEPSSSSFPETAWAQSREVWPAGFSGRLGPNYDPASSSEDGIVIHVLLKPSATNGLSEPLKRNIRIDLLPDHDGPRIIAGEPREQYRDMTTDYMLYVKWGSEFANTSLPARLELISTESRAVVLTMKPSTPIKSEVVPQNPLEFSVQYSSDWDGYDTVIRTKLSAGVLQVGSYVWRVVKNDNGREVKSTIHQPTAILTCIEGRPSTYF